MQPRSYIIQQHIFEKFYLQKSDGSKKADLYAGDVERVMDGVMHSSRTEAWVVILQNMLREIIVNFDHHITAIDKLGVRFAALMNDSAYCEEESEENCQNFLEGIQLSPPRAYFYASLITTKALNLVIPHEWVEAKKLKYCRMLLQSAVALDDMRYAKEFDLEKLSCWQYFVNAGQPSQLIKLAKNVLDIIAQQYDLMYDCKIMIGGECIYQRKATLADKYLPTAAKKQHDGMDLKKQYEHDVQCREKIFAEIRKHAFLRKYCQGMEEDLSGLRYVETSSMELVNNIAASEQYRCFKYLAHRFEFLLALDQQTFAQLNAESIHSTYLNSPLLIYMLAHGGLHFYDKCRALGLVAKDDLTLQLQQVFDSITQQIQELKVQPQGDELSMVMRKLNETLLIFEAAMTENHQTLFDIIFATLVDYADITQSVLSVNSVIEALLTHAIAQCNNPHYLICLLSLFEKFAVNLDFTDPQGRTLLHYAAQDKYSNYMRLCISSGYIKHINTCDENGFTPLQLAIQCGNKDAVDALLSVLEINPDITTIIDTAIAKDNIEIVLLLLNHFNVNLRSMNAAQQNILHLCGQHYAYNTLKYFLEVDKTVSPNLQDKKGNTCLHTLVTTKNTLAKATMNQFICLLFNAGVLPYVKNKSGYTALKLALRHKVAAAQTIATLQCDDIVFKMASIEKAGRVKFDDREWSIERLQTQFNNILAYIELNINPSHELLDRLNISLDKLLFIDHLASQHSITKSKVLQQVFVNAYSMILSEDLRVLDTLPANIEAVLRAQQEAQVEARKRLSQFASQPPSIVAQDVNLDVLHRQRIPKK